MIKKTCAERICSIVDFMLAGFCVYVYLVALHRSALWNEFLFVELRILVACLHYAFPVACGTPFVRLPYGTAEYFPSTQTNGSALFHQGVQTCHGAYAEYTRSLLNHIPYAIKV